MKKHELVFIVCRVFAIYVFIKAYETLHGVVSLSLYLRHSQAQNPGLELFSLVTTIVWFLSFLVAGTLFWKKAAWLSSKILSTSTNDNVLVDTTVDSFFIASIMIIGLWLFATSIPKCVNTLVRIFYFKQAFINMSMLDNISCFVELIVGMFMTFGSNMIAGFVRSIRKLGRQKD